MELKLQLVDTAGGGRRVLTSCLSSFSSPGTLGDVSGGSFFFFSFKNVVRKSDQSQKLESNKNMDAKFQNSPQRFTLMLDFLLPDDPSVGLLSS